MSLLTKKVHTLSKRHKGKATTELDKTITKSYNIIKSHTYTLDRAKNQNNVKQTNRQTDL